MRAPGAGLVLVDHTPQARLFDSLARQGDHVHGLEESFLQHMQCHILVGEYCDA